MTFDPFGDSETSGYLKNAVGSNDPAVIKRLERDAFRSNLDEALAALKDKRALTYQDVLDTHKRLFSDVYPSWAGSDRSVTAPDLAITKGGRNDLFAHPGEVKLATEYALSKGQDQGFMRENPGTVFGTLAYAHPFLEGNGRTILAVHSELCRRAGIHIDWSATKEGDFLKALTAELDRPGRAMNEFLRPHVRQQALDVTRTSESLQAIFHPAPGERKYLVSPHSVPDLPDAVGRVLSEHRDMQARMRVGIPSPSPELRAALSASPEEKGQRLQATELKKEFGKLEAAFQQRLSGADRSAIRGNQIEVLAQSLKVTPEIARDVASLVKQVDAGRQLLRGEERIVAPSREPGLSR
ncbi:Fic/DOC family protein [Microvirga alba]|uniref:protein adenylyltransferase n=1 Tax=Microvirga alba TaxID=2791025 RepID=A0A931FQ51_9HYPH|nr:Fic family protein [Microvirga alba]MBF9235624.1 Fic family protein [Microvirga alba]